MRSAIHIMELQTDLSGRVARIVVAWISAMISMIHDLKLPGPVTR
jgi:hypothetical protein